MVSVTLAFAASAGQPSVGSGGKMRRVGMQESPHRRNGLLKAHSAAPLAPFRGCQSFFAWWCLAWLRAECRRQGWSHFSLSMSRVSQVKRRARGMGGNNDTCSPEKSIQWPYYCNTLNTHFVSLSWRLDASRKLSPHTITSQTSVCLTFAPLASASI